MKTKAQLKAKAQEALDRVKAINTLAETEKREMTDAEKAEITAKEKDIDIALEEIKRLENVETRQAAISAVSDKAVDTTGVIRSVTEPQLAVQSVRIEPKDLGMKGAELVGICAWGALRNKHAPTRTSLQHIEDYGFKKIADYSRQCREDEIKAAMSSLGLNPDQATAILAGQKAITSASAGDNMITTPFLPDFIEFLRNSSIFLSGGPRELDMSYGTLEIPGGATGAAATYGAEGAYIGYSQLTTRKVSMAAKHLRMVTAMSNILIQRSPLAVASIVGDDVSMALRLGMDAAGLRGDGTGDNPAGILSLVNVAHKFDVADENEPTYAEVDREAKAALTLWRTSNVPRLRPRWLMAGRTFTYLQFLRDGNGNKVYPGLDLPNPVWIDNIPVAWSEQIPTNLGSGTDESEIYLNDFGHTLMGISRSVQITASQEASYIDGSAAHISAFSREETVIRGVCSHDFDMRHTKAAVVMQKVKWGAA